MKQALVKDLRCTVSAAVGADLFFGQHHHRSVKIHPTPIGHAKALIEPAAFQRLSRILIAAVAYEQGRDVGIHVCGAGIDAGHPLFISQLFTLLINFTGQVGHAEQIHILKAVGLPKLCFFGQHIFGRIGIKIHLRCQRLFMCFTQPHIKITLIKCA